MSRVKVVAILAARPGKAEALGTLLDGLIAPSRTEPGNLRYDLWPDQADPSRFVLDELHAGGDAVAAHRASPNSRIVCPGSAVWPSVAPSRSIRSTRREARTRTMALKDVIGSKLGFGAAPLGNMFRDIPEEEAHATVEAAWNDGIRYFDNAPFYGAGLAEIRMGAALKGKPRDQYVISTKVGRIVLDELEHGPRDNGEKGTVFAHGRPNKVVNDYSADATLRSIEDSLKRLQTDRIDIVWVHDIAQDFYGDDWLAMFDTARTGAFRTLDRLRDEGVIKAWGLGVNRVEPIELLLDLDEPRPDGSLLAGRYTLLDHSTALQRLIPKVAERGLGIVVGGPYSSGALVGGPNFEYAPATPAILDKVARIKAIADRDGVSMKAAGLQFALANPAVAAVIPGASRPGRIAEDRAALEENVPAAFWRDLRETGLVDPAAPVPILW